MNSALDTSSESRPTLAVATETAAEDPLAGLPVTIVERRPGWRCLDVRELWRYRELLLILAWRDIQVRYKQTLLGAAWAVLQPLATMLAFWVVLGRLAASPEETVPYPLFVLAGLIPWTFFANGVSAASQSVVSCQSLVTKVYFPRLLLPMGAIGANLVDCLVAFGLFIILMFGYGVYPNWRFLLALPLMGGVIVASLGVGILLAALTVRYRDFRHVVPFMIQIWMFATPCIYLQSDAAMSSGWQALLPFNPVFGFILNFRQALLGMPLDMYPLILSATVSLSLFLLGCYYFRSAERGFADVI
jgi:lipopolysaccharide transport system permease protein